MMHIAPVFSCIHVYNLRILNKLSVVVNDYTFVHINYIYNKNILTKLNIAINNYPLTTISHVMRWATNEDHHII